MVYFDTSFLAPLVLEEATSTDVEKFLADLSLVTRAVSDWTLLEFSSLLAREVRMEGLNERQAQHADAAFEAMVEDSFIVLMPGADDFMQARQYLGHYATGLRSGDALHLAIAGNNRAEAIYSFDKALLRAGKVLGLPVTDAGI